MRLLSWNVNGFRAVAKKNFWEWLGSCGGDVIALQETKLAPDQISESERQPEGYTTYWNHSKVKKGYSGTACFCRKAPLSSALGLPDQRFKGEGRSILLEFNDFYFFNIYFPNGQMGPERLAFKLGYYEAWLKHAEELRQRKPIVVCGDFNTAHTAIDLKNPKANAETSGFLPVERAWLDRFVAAGYLDTFRLFEPGPGNYSWWSYKFKARERNAGWRIDYFFVSEELRPRVRRAWIENQVLGSDHCPVGLELDAD